MLILIIKTLTLLTAILNILFGFFVLSKSKNDKIKFYFSIFAIIIGLWVFDNFLLRINANYYFLRLAFSIGALLPFFNALWLFYFLGSINKTKKIILFSLFVLSLFFFIAPFIGDLIVKGNLVSTDPFTPFESGSIYLLYVLYNSLAIIIPLIITAIIWKASYGIKQMQIKYIFFGLILFSFGPVVLSLVLPLFDIQEFSSLDSPFSIFFVVFSAYSIIRYRFMDIRLVIKKGVVYIASIVLVMGTGLTIFLLINWYLIEGSFNYTRVISGFILFTIFMPIFSFTLQKMEKISNRLLFRKIYDNQTALKKLSDETTKIIELDKLIETIVDTVMKSMGLNRAGILLTEKIVAKIAKDKSTPDQKQAGQTQTDKGQASNYYKIAKVIGFVESNGISLVQDNFLTEYLKRTKKSVVFEELELMIRDADDEEEKTSLKNLRQNMEKIEAGLCLPLFSHSEMIGIIVLGNKLSNEAYTKEDLHLLDTLANQSSVAISNARLYHEVIEARAQVENFNKILQNKVDEATAELREKNRNLADLLKMKSEFLTIASHQLRTPTSIVRGMLSMLVEDADKLSDQQKKEFIDQAYSSINHLERIIHDLLSATEIEGGKMEFFAEPLDIVPIINQVVKERQALAKQKNVVLEWLKPSTKLALVIADSHKLEELVSNLIDNAIHYTPKGKVVVTCGQKAEEVFISVADTGVGLSEDDKKILFQRFKRGQGIMQMKPNGSGLGLYIVKGIIDGLHGRIIPESAGRGKGSIFTVYLPILKK